MELFNGIFLIALCSIALSAIVATVFFVLWYKESKKSKKIYYELDDAIQGRERILVKPVSRVES